MQQLINNLERGYNTKSNISSLLNQLFHIAMELDICTKNYAEFISVKKERDSQIHKPFSEEEIAILFNNVFSHELVDTILITIYSGMRIGELLNLQVKNIDLAKRIMIGGSKTEAGKNRIIPIHTKILPLIRRRYNEDNTYLIENSKKQMPYKEYRTQWNKIMTDLHMEHLPHDGRHTFATLMDNAGANKLAIKKIMGHASSDITDKIYIHKNQTELLKNIDLI